ncbi:MAG: Ig-like domain-containing protein, partial [Verrucomicrobiota bacterium]
TPAANSCGTATITVTVNNQGASNNIVTQSFLVTVAAVNQPPTLNALGNLTINENGGQQTVNLGGISSGAANQTQTLVVTASSSNPSLIPNPSVTYTSPGTTGSLSFTPTTNNNGTATITVSVNNQGASNNIVTQSFLVTVAAVNQPPTLNALANVTINENGGQQTVNLTGIGSGAANQTQTLVVTAVSSNPSLIPNPTITYASPNTSGTLKFAPVTNSYGTATITATVNNGGLSNNIVSRSFVVTVNPVNHGPTLAALNNVAVVAACGKQQVSLTGISSGLVNSSQPVTITASSSNTRLVATPTVSYVSASSTGTLSFAPAATATGTATLSVTVNNGQSSNNRITRSFVVTVLAKGSAAPSLTSPFTNRVVLAGQTVNLTAAATGTTPLAYQWQCNSVPLPGATNATLSLPNITPKQSGQYSVSVSNLLGSTNATATVSVYATAAATLAPAVAPVRGQFALTVAGVSGYEYVVQASTNLTTWTSIATHTGSFTFVDTNAGKFPHRYYRSFYMP